MIHSLLALAAMVPSPLDIGVSLSAKFKWTAAVRTRTIVHGKPPPAISPFDGGYERPNAQIFPAWLDVELTIGTSGCELLFPDCLSSYRELQFYFADKAGNPVRTVEDDQMMVPMESFIPRRPQDPDARYIYIPWNSSITTHRHFTFSKGFPAKISVHLAGGLDKARSGDLFQIDKKPSPPPLWRTYFLPFSGITSFTVPRAPKMVEAPTRVIHYNAH